MVRLFGIFKIRFLKIGLYLAFPPMTALALQASDQEPPPLPVLMESATEAGRLKVPVEVVTANGAKAEWLMVEVNNDTIPEPGTMPLLAGLSTLLLFRRRREE